ncbi:PSD1 and planctomycete cytochrome C domain-containing protein [Roseiconus nitratireducens]|nr:PSD1 and planctomycete cytochrome C domain-containing protein [Roseiconus nitratireducens]
MKRFLLCVFLAFWTTACVAGSPVELVEAANVILRDHCLDCHGAQEQNGGLRLDGVEQGLGDSGKPAIVPGQPKQSELLARVRSSDSDIRMPPEGESLTTEQIAQLEKWIAAGAPWPNGSVADERTDDPPESEHWSFQPVGAPSPPSVNDTTWPRGAIDGFIQFRREQAGLAVAPDADALTLLRRASYALTGLPPTVAEIDRFQQQVARVGRQRAFAALIDDLLSRPSYGERWGRHWMDWVRYADTAGDNSDYPIPQAYLYRNYIIDSFNQDLPYDQFLTEQLAGDLLPADTAGQRDRQTVATGYLAMARRFGSLVERYPWHLTIEDTIDNVGRTMLGMTLACARCHDHKFDPVSTRDYYGLYGIFASTRYPFPGIELFQTQRDFVPLLNEVDRRSQPSETTDKTKRLVKELESQLAKCERQAVENAQKEKSSDLATQRRLRDELDAMLLKARRAGERLADHLKTLPTVPAAYAVQDAAPTDARVQIKGEPTRPGVTVPRGFPSVLGGQRLTPETASSSSGRLQLARWITSPENPLTARVIVNRVWQRHFGTGLVPTTSDFGTRGQMPTHPELLDWLARDFMDNGWSIKHLHRRIMTSRTYALASQAVADNHSRDPDNALYWRFNRQRMDAESLRDTLMLLAGTLDTTPHTEPHPFPPRKDWAFTQHHPFKDDYESNRRSVYLMTKRLTADPYFQTFDGPDRNVCTSDRDQSVTSLQALYFTNDPLLHHHATQLSSRLLDEIPSADQRAAMAVQMILCRPADDREVTWLLQHVRAAKQRLAERPDAESLAWASLVRSLFRLNEFLYLD